MGEINKPQQHTTTNWRVTYPPNYMSTLQYLLNFGFNAVAQESIVDLGRYPKTLIFTFLSFIL